MSNNLESIAFMSLTEEESSSDPDRAPLGRSYTIVKRSGTIVPFRRERIYLAVEAAFRDTKKIPKPDPLPEEITKTVEEITHLVEEEAAYQSDLGRVLTVERIQDIVEVKLMETGHHDVARDYILYREERTKIRNDSIRSLKILRRDKTTFVRFNPVKIASALERAFRDTLEIAGPTPEPIFEAINLITSKVIEFALTYSREGKLLDIEMIQDEIERQLMAAGHHRVAKDYIIYREKKAEQRLRREEEEALLPQEIELAEPEGKEAAFTIIGKDGKPYSFNRAAMKKGSALQAAASKSSYLLMSFWKRWCPIFMRGLKSAKWTWLP